MLKKKHDQYHPPLDSRPLLAKEKSRSQGLVSDSWQSHYPTPACIVVLGDIVRSRQLRERDATQIALRRLIQSLNERTAPVLIARFEIREGDGIRGVLSSGEPIADILWEVDTELPGARMRIGVGRGGLSTFGEFPDDLDGPAYYAARDAIGLAARKKIVGGVFLGFGEYDDVMTTLAYSLADRRSDFTERQCRVVRMLLSGESKTRIAEEIGIKASSVHDIAQAAHWAAYSREHISLANVASKFEAVDAWASQATG
jgi:SatD family (SatD)